MHENEIVFKLDAIKKSFQDDCKFYREQISRIEGRYTDGFDFLIDELKKQTKTNTCEVKTDE